MKSTSLHLLIICLGLVAGYSQCSAKEWPQYRGADCDGISRETIAANWSAGGLKRLWTCKTPAGFSSFSVADGKAFTVVSREIDGVLTEVCIAVAADTGKELWAVATGPAKYRG